MPGPNWTPFLHPRRCRHETSELKRKTRGHGIWELSAGSGHFEKMAQIWAHAWGWHDVHHARDETKMRNHSERPRLRSKRYPEGWIQFPSCARKAQRPCFSPKQPRSPKSPSRCRSARTLPTPKSEIAAKSLNQAAERHRTPDRVPGPTCEPSKLKPRPLPPELGSDFAQTAENHKSRILQTHMTHATRIFTGIPSTAAESLHTHLQSEPRAASGCREPRPQLRSSKLGFATDGSSTPSRANG